MKSRTDTRNESGRSRGWRRGVAALAAIVVAAMATPLALGDGQGTNGLVRSTLVESIPGLIAIPIPDGQLPCDAIVVKGPAVDAPASCTAVDETGRKHREDKLVVLLCDGADLSGDCIAYYGPRRCFRQNGADYSWAAMPAGWNDRVSSVRGYYGCTPELWEHEGFLGRSVVCHDSCSDLAEEGFDNMASSFTLA